MKQKLMMFLFAGFLGAARLAMAEAPQPPVAVPSGCGWDGPVKADLDRRHNTLMERFQKWKTRADAFNQKYAGREFDADSPEAKDGAAEQAWLSSESQNYQQAAKAFKAEVDKFIESHKSTDVSQLQSQFESLRQEINLDRQVIQNFGFEKTVDQIEYWGTLPERQVEEAKKTFKAMLFDATLGSVSEAARAVGSLTPEEVDALNRLADSQGAPPLGVVAGARDVHKALEFLDKTKHVYEAADDARKGQMLEAAVKLGGLASKNPAFGLLLTADAWAAYQVYQSATAVKMVRDLTRANEGDLILLKSRSEKLRNEVDQLKGIKKQLAEVASKCDSTTLVR
jgi:hypothetical protein